MKKIIKFLKNKYKILIPVMVVFILLQKTHGVVHIFIDDNGPGIPAKKIGERKQLPFGYSSNSNSLHIV